MTTTADTTGRVIAVTGAATPLGDVFEGETLRADDPIVLAYPDMFVSADTPERERPNSMSMWADRWFAEEAEHEAKEREAFAKEAKRNRLKPQVDVLVATQDFVTNALGTPATIVKGSTAVADDPLVLAHPDMWRVK